MRIVPTRPVFISSPGKDMFLNVLESATAYISLGTLTSDSEASENERKIPKPRLGELLSIFPAIPYAL
jgi:hypothetical protein